jgi:RHS repeat-associated protein
LTTVTRDGAPLATYTYDANGNRTSVTTSAGTVVATYDNQDRILTFGDRTYTHTPHGEVQSWTDASGTTTLSYDVQGNLLAVNLPSGTTVEYVVDARNRRIGRRVNGVVTHRWLYQGQLRPVAELDAGGAVITRFVYGARAVAPEYMIRGGVTYRLVTDQVGSVRLVVDIASGAIAQRIDYGPWGEIVNDSNPDFQPFGYAGGLHDPLTLLVRFGVRDYDAEVGRWLSKDPIRFDGGSPNLFQYGEADPINLVDPSGLSSCASDCAAEVLGVDDFIDIGLILAGQPIPGSKDFRTPGSSRGTSIAGRLANAAFGDAKLPKRFPTIVGGPGTGVPFRIAGTASAARFVGRAVPVLGWALLAIDAASFGNCFVQCVLEKGCEP